MSEVPKRHIITEAFVNQMETIEKTLIEAHNQPSSYYTRRSRRDQQQPLVAGGSLGSTNGYYGKYSGYYPQNIGPSPPAPQASSTGSASTPLMNSVNQPLNPLMPLDVYGYRNNNATMGTMGTTMGSMGSMGTMGSLGNMGSMGSMGTLGTLSGTTNLGGNNTVPLVPHVPQIFDDQDSRFYNNSTPLMSSVSTGGLNVPTTGPASSIGAGGVGATITGGVTSTTNAAPTTTTGVSPAYKGSSGLSTFDPFCDNKESFYTPLFTSSNNSIFGSNFTSNNIWGDTNKTDAAVWG